MGNLPDMQWFGSAFGPEMHGNGEVIFWIQGHGDGDQAAYTLCVRSANDLALAHFISSPDHQGTPRITVACVHAERLRRQTSALAMWERPRSMTSKNTWSAVQHHGMLLLLLHAPGGQPQFSSHMPHAFEYILAVLQVDQGLDPTSSKLLDYLCQAFESNSPVHAQPEGNSSECLCQSCTGRRTS